MSQKSKKNNVISIATKQRPKASSKPKSIEDRTSLAERVRRLEEYANQMTQINNDLEKEIKALYLTLNKTLRLIKSTKSN